MARNPDDSAPLILLLGGARAGKSEYALKMAGAHRRNSESRVCFIATAQALDEDMATRIARHREQRPSDWQTIEEPYQVQEALRRAAEAEIVIVDCLTLLVSNWLLLHEDEHKCEQFLRQITREFLELKQSQRQTVICVSNEVGLGIVPETRLGRVFRDLLGRVNQDFATAADQVYLFVAGLPLQLKPTSTAFTR